MFTLPFFFRRPRSGPAISWNADDPEGQPQEIDHDWQDQSRTRPTRHAFIPRLIGQSEKRVNEDRPVDPYFLRQAERLLARAGITPENFQYPSRPQ